jgi:hypothetical protein
MNPSVIVLPLMIAVFPFHNVPFRADQEERSVPPMSASDSATSSLEGVVVDFTYGSFINAASFSAGSDGSLFVLDGGNNTLTKFASDGSAVKTIGGKGWGNFEFDQPTGVCASFPLNIYVADYNNRRVQQFDRKLNYVQSLTDQNLPSLYSGEFYPAACAISSQGELFILETEGKRVLKFDQNQIFQMEFGSYSAGAGALSDPRDITVTPSDRVFVLDAHRVVAYDIFGNYVSSFSLLSPESPKALSSTNDEIVVTFPSSIKVFSSDGRPQFQISFQAVIGLPPNSEFRDALLVPSPNGTESHKIVILTSHEVVIARQGP